MLAKLTNSQRNAFTKIMAFLAQKEGNRLALLEGQAGTGKTFLLQYIIKEYLKINPYEDVLVVAPTHKAKAVAIETIGSNKRVVWDTLHSSLGYKHKYIQGVETFVKEDSKVSKIMQYGFVIIDEASMISREMLEDLVSTVKNDLGMKVLFVGDRFQLPPVNEPACFVFRQAYREFHGILHCELTEVVRQVENSPILKLARDIRKGEFNPIESDSTSVISDKNILRHKIDNLFRNPEDADISKILAWTNKEVHSYTGYVRSRLFPGCENIPIVEGDRLIFRKPLYDIKGYLIYHTNQSVKVVTAPEEKFRVVNGRRIYVNSFGVMSKRNRKPRIIEIVAPRSKQDYKESMKELYSNALITNMWDTYIRDSARFAKLRYDYALTVHLAQGSTFDNVIMVQSDINKNLSKVDKFKLMYVACTRPRHKLYIYTGELWN